MKDEVDENSFELISAVLCLSQYNDDDDDDDDDDNDDDDDDDDDEDF